MEKWQREIIRRNKNELVWLMDGNTSVLTALESKGLISNDNTNTLSLSYLNRGKQYQANQLLNIVVTKTRTDDENPNKQQSSFDFLIQTLRENTQSGAAELLQRGKDAYLAKQAENQSLISNSPNTQRSNFRKYARQNNFEAERLKKKSLNVKKKCTRSHAKIDNPLQDVDPAIKENFYTRKPVGMFENDERPESVVIFIESGEKYGCNNTFNKPELAGNGHKQNHRRQSFPKMYHNDWEGRKEKSKEFFSNQIRIRISETAVTYVFHCTAHLSYYDYDAITDEKNGRWIVNGIENTMTYILFH